MGPAGSGAGGGAGAGINVKDHGAKGDGHTDDTAALRAAVADAFGAPGFPHGGNELLSPNQFDNRELYFPNGDYRVSSLPTLTISALTDHNGEIQATVTPYTTAYHSRDMVEIYGDEAGTGVNGVWAISVDSPTQITLKYSDSSAIAGYVASSASVTANPLQLASVRGFIIKGGGKANTRIFNSNGGVFATNGCDYGRFSDMTVMAGGAAPGREITAIEFNWDGTGTTALQATTFQDMVIGGSSTHTNFGARVGRTGFMGSEIRLLDVHFGACDSAGFASQNQNALLLTMTGGQCQGCAKGIWGISGTIANLYAVSFQENGWDYYQGSQGSPQDTVTLIGCRSESENFCHAQLGAGTLLLGCSQANSSPDAIFVEGIGPLGVFNCSSETGIIRAYGGGATLYGMGNYFRNPNWLDTTTQIHAARAISMGFINARDVADSTGNLVNATFASLQPPSLRIAAAEAVVYDSDTAEIDAVIGDGGANQVKAVCKWDTATAAWAWKVLTVIRAA